MAIELGANLVGEVLIFSIAGGCLIFEYNRQQAKETKKEELRLLQMEKFTEDISSLQITIVQQESEIKYLNTVVEELAKKSKINLPPKTIESNAKSENEQKLESTSVVQKAIVYVEKDIKKNS